MRQRQGELPLTHATGDQAGIALLFYLLGTCALAQKHFVRATQLLGIAEVQRQRAGGADYHTLGPQARLAVLLETLRTTLGEARFTAAWHTGQALTVEQAIADALVTPASPDMGQPPATPNGLTAREVEVLRLLAQRFTYAEIAEQLVISRRTGNAHVTAIYSKLNVTTRKAAVALALEDDLL